MSYVESLRREEFGALFVLVDFVFSPNLFEIFVFNVLRVASRLSDMQSVPKVFEFSFRNVYILKFIG